MLCIGVPHVQPHEHTSCLRTSVDAIVCNDERRETNITVANIYDTPRPFLVLGAHKLCMCACNQEQRCCFMLHPVFCSVRGIYDHI
jgi:hypothetical protein